MAEGDHGERSYALEPAGLLYRVVRRLGYTRAAERARRLRFLLFPLFTWGPLLVLSAIQHVALPGRVRVPLLYDFAAYLYLWVAVPLLLGAENFINQGLAISIRHLADDGLLTDTSRPRFERAFARLERARTLPVEPLVLTLVVGNVLFGSGVVAPISSCWRSASPLAASWYMYVAVPAYQFLVFRWMWWLGCWSVFLGRIARLRMRLVPTHPDQRGGLGVINIGHMRFSLLILPVSLVVAAQIGERMVYEGVTVAHYKGGIVVVFLLPLLMLMPLLPFTPQLLMTRMGGLAEYGAFASGYTQAFRDRWMRKPHRQGMESLGTQDIQALSDLMNSFETVRKVGVFLGDAPLFLSFVLAAALPMLPLFLSEIPLPTILHAFVRTLG